MISKGISNVLKNMASSVASAAQKAPVQKPPQSQTALRAIPSTIGNAVRKMSDSVAAATAPRPPAPPGFNTMAQNVPKMVSGIARSASRTFKSGGKSKKSNW